MKHEKLFFVICGSVLLITLAMLVLLILVISGHVYIPTGLIIVLVFCILIMTFLSFCCACIFGIYLDDWRRLNGDRRWKK
jgi:hypothetical protein